MEKKKLWPHAPQRRQQRRKSQWRRHVTCGTARGRRAAESECDSNATTERGPAADRRHYCGYDVGPTNAMLARKPYVVDER